MKRIVGTHSPRSVVSDVAVLVAAAAAAADVHSVAVVTVVSSAAVLRLRGVRRGGGPPAHPGPVLVQHPTLATPSSTAR